MRGRCGQLLRVGVYMYSIQLNLAHTLCTLVEVAVAVLHLHVHVHVYP